MNTNNALSVSDFQYQLINDQIEVRHEDEVVGTIIPAAQQQISYIASLFKEKLTISVGNQAIEIYQSDWNAAIAPRVKLLEEFAAFNPQNGQEAKKCLRIFLEAHQLNEGMIYPPAGKVDAKVCENARQVFDLMRVARKVSIQSGRMNAVMISLLERRMLQAGSTAGIENVIKKIFTDSKKSAVYQLIGATVGGVEIEKSLNVFLQFRGVNEYLLSSTDLNSDVVIENAQRARVELKELYSKLIDHVGVSDLLLSTVKKLWQMSLAILCTEPSLALAKEEAAVLRQYFPEGFGTDTSHIVLETVPADLTGRPQGYDYLSKVKLIGGYNAGLNHLIHRLCNGESTDTFNLAGFRVRTSAYRNQNASSKTAVAKLQIWKRPSKEEDQKHAGEATRWRGAHLVALSFDLSISSEDVLRDLKQYVEDIRYRVGDAPVILVGTKLDALKNDPNAKQKLLDLKAFAEEHHLPYCATSALTGEGVEQFHKLMLSSLDAKLQKYESQIAASSS